MKKTLISVFTAGAITSVVGAASAQQIYLNLGPNPGYGPPPYGYQPPCYGPPVLPKNPALSVLVSVFVPGVGSMINGDVEKGVGILVGYVISAVFSVVLIGLPFLIGFWLWGVIDAYQGAQRWNARHGIVS